MGQSGPAPATFDRLWREQSWQQIPNCPGRFRLASRQSDQAPAALIGGTADVCEYNLTISPDDVLVTTLKGGGLISYRCSNQTYVHTLNTPEGFACKLKQLGIG